MKTKTTFILFLALSLDLWSQDRGIIDFGSIREQHKLSLVKDEDYQKMPNFFFFQYTSTPHPGKRYWMRISKDIWLERYESGVESRYQIVGRGKFITMSGTVVTKVEGDPQETLTFNDGSFLAFIPDKESLFMNFYFQNLENGDENWKNLAALQKVE